MRKNYLELISINNDIPCFYGSKVTLEEFFDFIINGKSIKQFIRKNPDVSEDMCIALLENTKESYLVPFIHLAKTNKIKNFKRKLNINIKKWRAQFGF